MKNAGSFTGSAASAILTPPDRRTRKSRSRSRDRDRDRNGSKKLSVHDIEQEFLKEAKKQKGKREYDYAQFCLPVRNIAKDADSLAAYDQAKPKFCPNCLVSKQILARHSLRDCKEQGNSMKIICTNCGKGPHWLSDCKEPLTSRPRR